MTGVKMIPKEDVEKYYQEAKKELENNFEILFNKFKNDKDTYNQLLDLKRITKEIITFRKF